MTKGTLRELCDLLDEIRGGVAVDELCFEVAEGGDFDDIMDEEDRKALERVGDGLSEYWNDLAAMCDKYYDRLHGVGKQEG